MFVFQWNCDFINECHLKDPNRFTKRHFVFCHWAMKPLIKIFFIVWLRPILSTWKFHWSFEGKKIYCEGIFHAHIASSVGWCHLWVSVQWVPDWKLPKILCIILSTPAALLCAFFVSAPFGLLLLSWIS